MVIGGPTLDDGTVDDAVIDDAVVDGTVVDGPVVDDETVDDGSTPDAVSTSVIEPDKATSGWVDSPEAVEMAPCTVVPDCSSPGSWPQAPATSIRTRSNVDQRGTNIAEIVPCPSPVGGQAAITDRWWRMSLQAKRPNADSTDMAYRYHLHMSSSGETNDYPSFAEASRAIAASVGSNDEPWELVRTNDGPEPWTTVLTGAGPPTAHTRCSVLRHYHPTL